MALGPFYVAQQMSIAARLRGIALLMRHGETTWNREGRVMGRQPVELSERGRRQVAGAIPVARALAPEIIISSPLIRARQSAEIIAGALGGIPVQEDSRLEEVNYGWWEGMTYHQLIKEESYLEHGRNPLTGVTPGGETIRQVLERGIAAVTGAMSVHPGKRLLFVSHGDIIRTVLCHFMKLELEHFRRIRVDNATFFGIELAGDFAEIKFLNLLADPERAFAAAFSK